MKGLGRMIVFGATALATLGCQGCIHVGATYPAISPPVQAYEVVRPTPDSRSVSPGLSFDVEFEKSAVVPRLAFEAPTMFDGPLRVSTEKSLSSSKLYSSAALANVAGDRKKNSLSPVPMERRNLTAAVSLSAAAEDTGLGFDVGVAPRVAFTREGDIATRRIGGEVRIGQNFDKRGEGDPGSGWYFFAGADGEALVWEPGGNGIATSYDMALRDKVTVGDAQVGVTFQHGLGQLSLSYIQREVEYRERNIGGSDNEQFAGVTFTIRK